MTTSIKVSAHCADDREVVIDYKDNNGAQQQVIQDGEEFETVVYDDLCCSARERPKVVATPSAGGDGKTRPKPDTQ